MVDNLLHFDFLENALPPREAVEVLDGLLQLIDFVAVFADLLLQFLDFLADELLLCKFPLVLFDAFLACA